MKVLQRNLDALEQRFPDLAQDLRELKDSGTAPGGFHLEIVPTSSGDKSLAAVKDHGQRILLHSAHNPKRETSRTVSAFNLEKGDNLIIFGIGLGYHLLELVKSVEGKLGYVLVLERSPEILLKAMETVDMAGLIIDSRISFITGEDLTNLSQRLVELASPTLLNGVKIFDHRPSISMYPQFYADAGQRVVDQVRHGRSDIATSFHSGAEFQRNVLLNIPHFIRCTGMVNLLHSFVGRPAVVVAAGPSLNKNIDQLTDLQDSALIVTVDTSYQILREHGIKPHIVLSIDPSDISMRHFSKTEKVSDMVLGFDPECYFGIHQKFVGPKIGIGMQELKMMSWLENLVGPIGSLKKGNTVAHTSFYLVRALKCDPIIFVGLDLALSAEQGATHVSGAALGGTYKVDPDDRNFVIMSRPKNPNQLEKRQVYWVPAIGGGEVPSTNVLYVYLRQFEMQFARTQAKIIDATEGGALKASSTAMTLAEAAAKYCSENWSVEQALQACLKEPPDQKVLIEAVSEIRLVQERLREITLDAERGYRAAETVIEILNRERQGGGQLTKNMNEVNQLVTQLQNDETVRVFLQRGLAGSHYIMARRVKPPTGEKQSRQLALELVGRRKTFFQAVATFAANGAELLDTVVADLEGEQIQGNTGEF